jgi:nucleoside-diphosphate-sugar epimerase
MRGALVFGASSQIGAPLLARLVDAGWQVLAVSRDVHADRAGVRWLRGDLQHVDGLPDRIDAIFSAGPLDHFARWYADARIEAPRVVAFGSTSLAVKQDSPDPAERDVARRLDAAEAAVFAVADQRQARATLLRPTLVYGAGRDRTLTRIAQFARRHGAVVLPTHADGLRQPVHVDDLADAALLACDAVATAGRAYALPGGETLPYREMVARVLATLQPRPRLVELPGPLFRLVLAVARASGRAGGFGDAAVARLREDLVFDLHPAQHDFGYRPRAFQPGAGMFGA